MKTYVHKKDQYYYLTACFASVYSEQYSEKEIQNKVKQWFNYNHLIKKDHHSLTKGNPTYFFNKESLNMLQTKGGLIATMHMGNYANIVSALLTQKIGNIQIVVSKQIFDQQGDFYQKLAADHQSQIDILVAENVMSLRKVIKHVRNGGISVIFMDGNAGVGKMDPNDKNRLKINFLSKPASVKTGVAYIASMANVPVVGAISFYNHQDNKCIRFSPHFYVKDRSEMERANCIKQLYAFFETVFHDHSEQWEGWFYPYRLWLSSSHVPVVTQDLILKKQSELYHLCQHQDYEQMTIAASPLNVGILSSSDDHIIFDSKTRLVLQANQMACHLIYDAYHHKSFATVIHHYGMNVVINELTRLILCGWVVVKKGRNR